MENNILTRSEQIQAGIACLLLVSVVLFSMDRFVLPTPAGRFVPADILSIMLVLFSAIVARNISENRQTIIIVAVFALLGLLGLINMGPLAVFNSLANPSRAVVDSMRYLLFAGTILFLVPVLSKKQIWAIYIKLFVISCIIVLIVSFGQILAISNVSPFNTLFMWEKIRGGGSRIAGTFRWQGPYVLYLALMLPILSTLTLTANNSIKRVKYSLLIVSCLIAIVYSGSRSGFLLLPFSLSPIFIIGYKRGDKFLTSTLAILIIGFLFLISLFDISAGQRILQRLFEAIADPTNESRFAIWSDAIYFMMNTSPLFGIGAQQTAETIGRSAHSSYVGITVERGLVGLLLLVILVGHLLRTTAQLLSAYFQGAPPIVVAIACMVPVLLVYFSFASGLNYRITPIIIALILSTREIHTRSPNNEKKKTS